MPLPATAYPLSPRYFGRSLSGPPLMSSDSVWPGALIRWWRDVAPDIAQPALNQHYLTMHLGGAKRIRRSGEGRTATVDIEAGALSIVPAGAAYQWSTRGPVEFAHIYLAPAAIEQVSAEEFDRDAAALCLEDRLGVKDNLMQALFLTMIEELAVRSSGSRMYLDTLLHSLTLRLLRTYSSAPSAPLRTRQAIAPARLRRVTDYIEANLADDIALADIAAVAAMSPFHFSRAFAKATGTPPYAYVIQRRIALAKTLLANGSEPVHLIAVRCGFHSAGQFCRMFKRATGYSPLGFRPNDTTKRGGRHDR